MPFNNREGGAYRGGTGSSFQLAFSHNFCLRDVAWFHPVYAWTKRGDAGTTSPTALARQELLPKQSKYRFAPLQHRPLIIAQVCNGCSRPPQWSGQSEWASGEFEGREAVDSRGLRFRVEPGSAIRRPSDIERRIQSFR